MTKERTMEDALKSMVELVEKQQKAIRTADELIKLKGNRLDIADQLINIYKKENKILKICFYSVVALHIISLIILNWI